jgi:hypothetical protein
MVTDGHEITSAERLLGSFTGKPTHPKSDGATSACPASLGKNNLFFPRAAAVDARADHMPEVEPSPGSVPGGEARRANVAREMPPLSAVTDALRVHLGIASDLSSRASENIRSA